MTDKEALYKKNDPYRYQSNTHSFHQLIQGTDHLRLFLILHGFRLQGQSGNIRFIPNFFQTGITFSGNNKASGHKKISFFLYDLLGFSCKKGLVYPHFARTYHCVRADLISRIKYDDIVPDQMGRIYRTDLSFPYHVGLGGIEHIHLFQNIFRPDLLDDPHHSIQQDHRQESQIPEGT